MATASRSSSRANSSARNEILQMLIEDHKKVKKAFRRFEQLDVEDDPEECGELVETTCAEVLVHATIEEEILYPAAREALRDGDLIDEAEVEHQSAHELLDRLKGMEPGDEKYAALFTVLGEYLKHHIKEEEGEMFPQLMRARLDWEALAGQMRTRRAEMMRSLGLEVEEDEDEEQESGEGAQDEERGRAAGQKGVPARGSGGRQSATPSGNRSRGGGPGAGEQKR